MMNYAAWCPVLDIGAWDVLICFYGGDMFSNDCSVLNQRSDRVWLCYRPYASFYVLKLRLGSKDVYMSLSMKILPKHFVIRTVIN